MISLRGQRILLGGPIKALFAGDAFDDTMRIRVQGTIAKLEDHGAEVFSAHAAENFSRVTLTSQETTLRDFEWVRACDAYVAILPTDASGVPVASAGTAVELGWATAMRTPVVLLMDMLRWDGYSHLVRGLNALGLVRLLDIEAPLDELIDALKSVEVASVSQKIEGKPK